jgi:hypothetical protein
MRFQQETIKIIFQTKKIKYIRNKYEGWIRKINV